MSEGNLNDEVLPDGAQPEQTSGPQRAGRMLREQREKLGLHIAAMSVALKVPVSKIDALENGRLEDLPGTAFTRSLASTICRHLKIDPAPVLVLLPAHEVHTLVQVGEGINTPFRKPGDLVSAAEAWRRMRPTAYAVIALLLAALLIYVFPAAWLKLPNSTMKAATQSVPSGVTQTEVVEPVLPQAAASQAQPEAPTPVAASPEAVVSQPVSIPAPAAPGEQGTNVVMSFHAAADSWVEVQDRDRQVVLKKLIKAGETQLAQGKPPLNVSIGNAEKTTVQVRGKPFDLAPATRENVARFTVQ